MNSSRKGIKISNYNEYNLKLIYIYIYISVYFGEPQITFDIFNSFNVNNHNEEKWNKSFSFTSQQKGISNPTTLCSRNSLTKNKESSYGWEAQRFESVRDLRIAFSRSSHLGEGSVIHFFIKKYIKNKNKKSWVKFKSFDCFFNGF